METFSERMVALTKTIDQSLKEMQLVGQRMKTGYEDAVGETCAVGELFDFILILLGIVGPECMRLLRPLLT